MNECENCGEVFPLGELFDGICIQCDIELRCGSCQELVMTVDDLDIYNNCEVCSELFCLECCKFYEGEDELRNGICYKCENFFCEGCNIRLNYDYHDQDFFCVDCSLYYCEGCNEFTMEPIEDRGTIHLFLEKSS